MGVGSFYNDVCICWDLSNTSTASGVKLDCPANSGGDILCDTLFIGGVRVPNTTNSKKNKGIRVGSAEIERSNSGGLSLPAATSQRHEGT